MDQNNKFNPLTVTVDKKNSTYCKSFTSADGLRIPTEIIAAGFAFYEDKEKPCKSCQKPIIPSEALMYGIAFLLARDLKTAGYTFVETVFSKTPVDALLLQKIQLMF